MWQRLHAMLIKELLQLKRDRGALTRLLLPLVVQLFVFGYAATFTVHHVATDVVDLDRSPASRALLAAVSASGRFDLVTSRSSVAAVRDDIDHDRVALALVIHAGFQQALDSGAGDAGAPLQVVVDGTNSNTALIALGYLQSIMQTYVAAQSARLIPLPPAAPPRPAGLQLQSRPWFNPGLADTWFFIPGVIGSLTLLQVVTLTAFAVVREREIGTLEQIMVSPIRPVEFILGKTLPAFAIGLASIALVSLLGITWFHVPFVGSPLVMLTGSCLFLLALIGMGLLLSTFSHTQQQAFALNFFFLNPFFILSGFAFPIASMPAALRAFTLVNPLRYFLDIIRAVFLKGVGFDVLWPQLLALAVLAVCMLGVSVWRFRAALDS